jgi:hypothetical protein
MTKTAFVTLTDRGYFHKALITLRDVRTYGQWTGPIVLITVDFIPTFEELKSVCPECIVYPISHIDHTGLWEIWKTKPIRVQFDQSHTKKVYQWDKFTVFSPFFKIWDRIVFLDAGARVVNPVEQLFSIPWEGRFLSPDDSDPYDNGNRLNVQFDLEANPEVTEKLYATFGTECFEDKYFLDCFFIFDTALIEGTETFNTLCRWMLEFPISCRNDMGIVNLYFTAHKKVWTPLPQRSVDNQLYNFGWSELNYHERPGWDKFIVLKYPWRIPPVK